MSAILFPDLSIHALLFRRSDDDPDIGQPLLENLDDVEVPGIRCPLCKWRPKRADTWVCWDNDYPEQFFGGCGTEWNTFETRGRCPTCHHQWRWTSCLQCWMWSRHEDWYSDE